jgi:hypothetical protein
MDIIGYFYDSQPQKQKALENLFSTGLCRVLVADHFDKKFLLIWSRNNDARVKILINVLALLTRTVWDFSILILTPSFIYQIKTNFIPKWSAKKALKSPINKKKFENLLFLWLTTRKSVQLYPYNFETFRNSIIHFHLMNEQLYSWTPFLTGFHWV